MKRLAHRLLGYGAIAVLIVSPFVLLGTGAYYGWRYIEAHRKPAPEPILVGIKDDGDKNLTIFKVTPEEYEAWEKYGNEDIRVYRNGETDQ